MAKDTDKPTIARIRDRLETLSSDITIEEARWVFGVATTTPIRSRIDDGTFSAAKVLGTWMIDSASIHSYLDKINSKF